MTPIIAAAMAQISTAPAAMSLVSPANLLYSGDIRLTNLSIAVLNASAAKTNAIHKIIIYHSVRDILHRMLRVTTQKVKVVCIQALCSFDIKFVIPLQA